MRIGTLEALVSENRELLRQTTELIGRLASHEYASPHPTLGCSSIGKHVRHVTDHYEALLHGHTKVNYDDRPRLQAVEHDPVSGQHRLNAIREQIRAWAEAILDPRSPIPVRHTVEFGHRAEPVELPSTASRELAFLANHTLHHMAIIGILASSQGVLPGADFGVALSTRLHLEEQQTARSSGEAMGAFS